MTVQWFSIDIFLLTGGNAIFSGYFSVNINSGNSNSGTVTSFYDYANASTNIYVNNGFDGEDSLFDTNPPYSFSNGGTNITSLPYLANHGTFFNLYKNNGDILDDTNGAIDLLDTNGLLIGSDRYNFVFKTIASPYPLPVNYYHRSLYTDNALVYYKPHSLAPGGIGGVRNQSIKARRI